MTTTRPTPSPARTISQRRGQGGPRQPGGGRKIAGPRKRGARRVMRSPPKGPGQDSESHRVSPSPREAVGGVGARRRREPGWGGLARSPKEPPTPSPSPPRASRAGGEGTEQ